MRTKKETMGEIHCRNISDNQNKHYIVDNVAGVNQCTTCLSRLLVAVELDKIGKRLWSLDSVFFPSLVLIGRGPVADRPSIVSFVGVPGVAYPSDWVSVDGIKKNWVLVLVRCWQSGASPPQNARATSNCTTLSYDANSSNEQK